MNTHFLKRFKKNRLFLGSMHLLHPTNFLDIWLNLFQARLILSQCSQWLHPPVLRGCPLGLAWPVYYVMHCFQFCCRSIAFVLCESLRIPFCPACPVPKLVYSSVSTWPIYCGSLLPHPPWPKACLFWLVNIWLIYGGFLLPHPPCPKAGLFL